MKKIGSKIKIFGVTKANPIHRPKRWKSTLTFFTGLALLVISCGGPANVAPNPLTTGTSAILPTDRFGVIGDSLAQGTHVNDSCQHYDIFDCLDPLKGDLGRMGGHEPSWTLAAGSQSWAIPTRLGYSSDQVINASWDGAEWDDAYAQAQNIVAAGGANVKVVLIHMGHNDVCIGANESYPPISIAADNMDQTLAYLTDAGRLAPGAVIAISDIVNIKKMRDLMKDVDHPFLTDTCQGLWDINPARLRNSVIEEMCRHIYNTIPFCPKKAVKDALKSLLDRYTDTKPTVCGKVLASSSTDADRQEAYDYNVALNAKMKEKAAKYHGRNNVTVLFSEKQFNTTLKPFMLSALDCFHANRWGQAHMGLEMWQGFDPVNNDSIKVFRDQWSRQSYSNNDGLNGTFSDSWQEYNDDNMVYSGKILQKTVRDSPGSTKALYASGDSWPGVQRSFNMADASNAWLSYNYRRFNMTEAYQRAKVQISSNGGSSWTTLFTHAGSADRDYSYQRGNYIDVTGYTSATGKLDFGMRENYASADKGIFFDNITVITWTNGPKGFWAANATASSVYPSRPASSATGMNNVSNCVDSVPAWRPATQSAADTLTLTFPGALYATGAKIYETHAFGRVAKVEFLNDTNVVQGTWTGADGSTCEAQPLTVNIPKTSVPVNKVRITLSTSKTGWMEIDAVLLIGTSTASSDVGREMEISATAARKLANR